MKKFQFVKIDLYHQDFSVQIVEEETVEKAIVKYYDDPELTIEEIDWKPNRNGGWKLEGSEEIICIIEVTE